MWRKLPTERTAKTQIRPGGCPGWSESSLGEHTILLVLSPAGSNQNLAGENEEGEVDLFFVFCFSLFVFRFSLFRNLILTFELKPNIVFWHSKCYFGIQTGSASVRMSKLGFECQNTIFGLNSNVEIGFRMSKYDKWPWPLEGSTRSLRTIDPGVSEE